MLVAYLSVELTKLDACYSDQKSAWMDAQTFNCFLKFGYKEVRKRNGEDVCLNMDKLPKLPRIEFIFLPPDITSVFWL